MLKNIIKQLVNDNKTTTLFTLIREEEKEKIFDLFNQGYTGYEIARLCGRSYTHVSNILTSVGIDIKHTNRRVIDTKTQKETVKNLLKEGFSLEEASDKIGRPVQYLTSILGFKKAKKKKKSDIRHEKVLKLNSNNNTDKEISDKTGLCISQVKNILRMNNRQSVKLCTKKRAHIKSLKSEGMSNKEIHRKYKYSLTLIYSVVNNEPTTTKESTIGRYYKSKFKKQSA